MRAYVLIKVRIGDISEVVRQMRRIDTVKEANMTFGPYDVVAVIEAKDVNHLGRILAASIQPIPGIVETLTCLAVEV